MRIKIQEALQLLQTGNVVAIPTETVYGLAADMHNSKAVDEVFAIKKRPNDKPLITLVSNQKQMMSFVEDFPPSFNELVQHFWPGALTLVIPIKVETMPQNVRAGLNTAGFRIPNHSLTRELLEQFGPVVAPSANLSSGPSATCAEHVEEDFGNSFPVLDGGPSSKGIESTILCFQDNQWQISRLGAISAQQLGEVLCYVPQMIRLSQAMASRYIPKVRLFLATKAYDGSIKSVLGFAERSYPGAANVFVLGSLEDPATISARLYTILREVDQQNISELWVDFNFPRVGELALLAEKLESFTR